MEVSYLPYNYERLTAAFITKYLMFPVQCNSWVSALLGCMEMHFVRKYIMLSSTVTQGYK